MSTLDEAGGVHHTKAHQPDSVSERQRLLTILARLLYPLILFGVAFFPRALGFVGSTSVWQGRAEAFMDALLTQNWNDTLQAPHPGVTTMWLAGLARQITSIYEPNFDRLPLTQRSSIELIPIALVVSLAIVLAYFLLANIFDRQIAIVSTLLLALAPYPISLSKAVHVDALVSIFMLISVLWLWLFIKRQSRSYIVLSGIFAGLSLLTKTPAIFMIPYFLLCILAWQTNDWLQTRETITPFNWRQNIFQRVRTGFVLFLIWLLALVVTYVLLWPSMWTQPVNALEVSFGKAFFHLESPHPNPIFFMGESTTVDPGPIFYPINMAVKVTAVAFIGFILSLFVPFRPQLAPTKRLAILLGLAFIFFFTIEMTLGEKKFARYALPALQFVTILAGVGWVYFLRLVTKTHKYLLSLFLVLVIAAQFGVSIPRHPYYGTHYNYLFGGPKRILESGITAGQEKGEGLADAANYLNTLPQAQLLVVGAHADGTFLHFFDGKTVPLTDEKVDYILFTRGYVLRRIYEADWGPIWESYRTRRPKHVVSFDDVPYVWIYKVGPVIEEENIPELVDADIGGAVRLLGYEFDPAQARPGETVKLTLYWESLAEEIGDYTVFTHLLDEKEQLVGQKDNQPQGGMYPTYLWDEGERVQDVYELTIDPTAPPGGYHFAVGMYSLQTMERIPIVTQDGEALPDNRLLLPGPEIRSSD